MPSPPASHVAHTLAFKFEDHFKCFRIVLDILNRSWKDIDFLLAEPLPSSNGQLALLLELLWQIQRNESLVGLIIRGLDRQYANSTSSELSGQRDKINQTKHRRRVQLAKLSVMWMRAHFCQVVLTNIQSGKDYRTLRSPIQQVLKLHIDLSPSSYHRATSRPYLSRLLTTPSGAVSYMGAANTFSKIWKAISRYLNRTDYPHSSSSIETFEELLNEIHDLSQALHITQASSALDLAKACVKVLTQLTLTWTLEAYRDAATFSERVTLAYSRRSVPDCQSDLQTGVCPANLGNLKNDTQLNKLPTSDSTVTQLDQSRSQTAAPIQQLNIRTSLPEVSIPVSCDQTSSQPAPSMEHSVIQDVNQQVSEIGQPFACEERNMIHQSTSLIVNYENNLPNAATNPKLPVDLNDVNDMPFEARRHSTGLANLTTKLPRRRRRSTDGINQARTKRFKRSSFMTEMAKEKLTSTAIGMFQDNPELLKALQEATEMALSNQSIISETGQSSDSEPSSNSGRSSRSNSVVGDQDGQLDSDVLMKLKANAARLDNAGSTHFDAQTIDGTHKEKR